MSEENKPADKKAKLPFSVRFAIFMSLVTAVVFLPLTLVLVVCMVPTFVATLVDRHPQKTAWLTVGAMNFAGTVPVCFALWDAGHTLSASLSLVIQPSTILISYGAATVGWLIYNNVTPFVASIIVSKNENRLKDIQKRQKELIKKWGSDITSV